MLLHVHPVILVLTTQHYPARLANQKFGKDQGRNDERIHGDVGGRESRADREISDDALRRIGPFTRENVLRWYTSLSEEWDPVERFDWIGVLPIEDFHAVCGDIDIPWATEEGRAAWMKFSEALKQRLHLTSRAHALTNELQRIVGHNFAPHFNDVVQAIMRALEELPASDRDADSILGWCKSWAAADTAQKQELQRALFPDGLMVSKENGYFERGNTTLMESWTHFFNSLEGSTGTASLENKFGRGERI